MENIPPTTTTANDRNHWAKPLTLSPNSQDATKMWTPQNETDIPHFSNSTFWPTNSSRFVYSANFIKLKNLSLSYNVPQNVLGRAGMRSVEIYVSGQNLFTITKYSGLDPEIGLQNANATQNGVDNGTYPSSRFYTVGLNVTF